MASEIVVQQPEVNPLLIFQQMVSSGATVEQLNGFLELQQKWEQAQLRSECAQDERAFNAAMVKFHLDPPKIWKDKHVEFKTDRGVTSYDHASLGNATELIALALAKVGIIHEWIPSQSGGSITVTCRLKLGMYSKDTTISSGPDKSGGKNDIQSVISTQSYLERHTLLAATGMATHDQDNDGAGNPQAALDAVVADLLGAKTLEELKTMFGDAYRQAAKRPVAQKAFKAASDKRKAELEAAKAQEAK